MHDLLIELGKENKQKWPIIILQCKIVTGELKG